MGVIFYLSSPPLIPTLPGITGITIITMEMTCSSWKGKNMSTEWKEWISLICSVTMWIQRHLSPKSMWNRMRRSWRKQVPFFIFFSWYTWKTIKSYASFLISWKLIVENRGDWITEWQTGKEEGETWENSLTEFALCITFSHCISTA